MVLARQAEYAAAHGVSRKTVTKWKQEGRLVFQGDLVDVDASDAKLRAAGLGRFKGAYDAVAPALPTGNKGNGGNGAPPPLPPPPDEADTEGNGAPPPIDVQGIEDFLRAVLDGRFVTKGAAEAIKENALAGQRALDLWKAHGGIVEMEVAETVLFEQARTFRDALLKWPDTAAPALANELQVPLAKVTETLTRLLHEFLADLGEPTADFSGEG